MLIPTSQYVIGLMVDGRLGAPPLGPGPISGGKLSAETDIQDAEPISVAVSGRTVGRRLRVSTASNHDD